MYAVCRGVSVSIYSSISVSVSISALVVLMEKLSARRRRRALHFFGYFTFGQSMWRLFVTATPPSSQSQSREALASQPATCPDFSLQSSDLKYSTRLRGYYARRSRVSIPPQNMLMNQLSYMKKTCAGTQDPKSQHTSLGLPSSTHQHTLGFPPLCRQKIVQVYRYVSRKKRSQLKIIVHKNTKNLFHNKPKGISH